MFKKIGLSVMALAAMLMLAAPPKASARVRFGVAVGPPAYTYPVDPYAYQYPYNTPQYNDPYAYNYTYPVEPYVYPAPGYVAPYYSFGFGWGGHDWGHEHFEHGREFHGGHEFHGGSHFHGGGHHR